MIKRRSY